LPARPGNLLRIAQFALSAIVLAAVSYVLYRQWTGVQSHRLQAHPRWGLIALSGVVFLATYALLIEVWRRMLEAWSAHLPFWTAARIWCVSNLLRYVPGKVWQIGAMGVMSRQSGASPVASTGSAILNTIVSIAAGILVAMLTGWRALDALSRGRATAGFIVLGATVLGFVLLPLLLPRVVRLAARLTGRPADLGPLPMRAVWIALVGNIAAWMLYGAAFRLFVAGVIGSAPGSTLGYVAAYASSYVVGYLALVVPGGLGVREGVMATALPVLGLTTAAQGLLIAVSSRLWLTILEVVPGVLFYARARAHPSSHPTDLADGPTKG